jgi:uncharacterized repeat protein (TIGR04076 family)
MGVPYKVRITVKEILGSGNCGAGFKVGDSWVSEGGAMPAGMCSWAFGDLGKHLTSLIWGGEFPGGGSAGPATCTDGYSPVIFHLERLEG